MSIASPTHSKSTKLGVGIYLDADTNGTKQSYSSCKQPSTSLLHERAATVIVPKRKRFSSVDELLRRASDSATIIAHDPAMQDHEQLIWDNVTCDGVFSTAEKARGHLANQPES